MSSLWISGCLFIFVEKLSSILWQSGCCNWFRELLKDIFITYISDFLNKIIHLRFLFYIRKALCLVIFISVTNLTPEYSFGVENDCN